MTSHWTPAETNTHQDHVIAHVLGATFLGYFVFDEALYILLDIGFVWTIFLDGEMGLLPHPVAISELELDQAAKDQIRTDVDVLLGDRVSGEGLSRMHLPPNPCQIEEVNFFAAGELRRLLLAGEDARLAIEMSLATREITVRATEK